MRPLIAITVECKHDPDDARSRGRIELNWNYAEAIAEAGGLPIIVPPMADMAEIARVIDGWLIPGGADMDACHFGEPNHPEAELQDPFRYDAESRLLEAVDRSMPIFGICYGCQFLNVARGGSLNQHLPDISGSMVHTGSVLQQYEVDDESTLRRIVGGAKIEGKSSHHQAINRLGKGLSVVARADDGTIEAIEATDHPWLVAVQWHPERTPESAESRALFSAFVQAAATFRKEKSAVPA